MRIRLSIEYEVDTDGFLPQYVDVESFAEDEAKRMLQDDLDTGEICAEDFHTTIMLDWVI